MSKHTMLLVTVAGVGFLSTLANAAVIYRETFPNSGGGNKSLSVEGWEARLRSEDGNSAGSTSGFSQFNFNSANPAGNPAPVNSNPQDASLTNGSVVNFFSGGFWAQPTLYYTNEYTLDRSANTFDSIEWFQNAQSGGSNGYRAAVEIGGSWYVNDQVFLGFFSPSLSISGSNWQSLAFSNLAISGSAAALPSGNITGFGLFTDRSSLSSPFEEFDNFTLNATPIPEPTTLSVLAIASSLFLRRGARAMV